ncbi:MAG: C-terminal binding protein [Planctomycetales bacterium]
MSALFSPFGALMANHRVVMTDYAWPNVDLERALLAEIGAELIVSTSADAKDLKRLVADADAILTCWAPVPQELLAAANKCRIVSRMGIGLDNIDVEAASELGITVTNVPDYCRTEVAEHALALLLTCGRRAAFFHHQSQCGVYDRELGWGVRRLEGQTLGIVGLGSIGRTLARKAVALGFQVVATKRPRAIAMDGVRLVDFEELLAVSDFVSLHLPLNETTRGMMGREQFERMKPTAFLINTARGGLVDHTALARALEENQLVGAALDVQEPEPPDLKRSPFNHPRVIVTPHTAFYSEESLEELRRRATGHVVDCLSGREPPHVVNAEALARRK